MKHFLTSMAFAGMTLAATSALAADYAIMAPAAPGGGWDQTARAMQEAMAAEGIGNPQVTNVPGAGGTIGLAQFANEANGNPNALIVGGYVMVGAILTNAAQVTLDNVTPIARLTGEYEAIVVPASSPIQTIDDLVAQLKADPGSVSWGGGSAGGTDHIAVGLDRQGGGRRSDGDQLHRLFGRRRSAGGHSRRSGDSRHFQLFASSRVRSRPANCACWPFRAPEPLEGVDAPTLKDSGLDVVVQNWRMVAAGPGLSDEQVATITADVEKMVNSKAWQDTLATKGWINTYLAGDEFKTQLAADIEATSAILKDIGLVQ